MDFAIFSSKNRILLTQMKVNIILESDNRDSLAFTIKHGHYSFTIATLISKYDDFSSTDGTNTREVPDMEQRSDKFDSLPLNRLSIDETLSIEAFDAVVIRCSTIKGIENSSMNAA